MNRTKKAIIASVLSLLLCVSMLIGATFAWFTDSVTSGKNKIVAGNLDIDVLHTNAHVTTAESVQDRTDLFTDKDGNSIKWEPGVVSYETFTVKNQGTLALKYKLAMNVTDYNILEEHTLKEVLKVRILEGSDMLDSVSRDTVAGLDWNSADTLGAFTASGNLTADGSDEFQVIVYWQPTANDNLWNANNGRKTSDGEALFIEFGIEVTAAQLNFETDSFDSYYDEGMILANLPARIQKTFRSDALVLPAGEDAYNVTDSVPIQNKSTQKTVAEMPAAAANAVGNAVKGKITDRAEDSDLSTVILLDVQTTDYSGTSVTYEIEATAVATYTATDGTTKTYTLSAEDTDSVLTEAGAVTSLPLDIGKELIDMAVTHNGTAMTELSSADGSTEGFYYDPDSGILTIQSLTFSPFAISYTIPDPIIAIGNVGYPSLASAFSACKPGETVKVLRDIEINEGIGVVGDVSLDLGTATVTFNVASGKKPFQILGRTGESNVLTITGTTGKIVSNTSIATILTSGCGIVVNGGTLQSGSGSVLEANGMNGVCSEDYSAVNYDFKSQNKFITINDGKLIGAKGNDVIRMNNSMAVDDIARNTLTINGGELRTESGVSCTLTLSRNCTAIIKNCTITANDKNGIVVNQDAVVTLENVTMQSKQRLFKVDGTAVLDVLSGSYTVTGTPSTPISKGKNGTIRISGGSFSVDPNGYLAEGYTATSDNGRYTVSAAS